MFTIGVLASTNGTDLQAIFEELNAGLMPGIEVKVVVSDKEKAGALEKARKQGVKAVWVNPTGKNQEEFERELIVALGEVDLVCLIGFMRILGPTFIRHFSPRHILNVHPSLLPKYGGTGWYGMKVHEAVITNGEKESGMTIHFVDLGVDSGPPILQMKTAIAPNETPESLKIKVQELEKKAYPEAIRLIAQERSPKLQS